ncbi:MAG: chromophore lyase CpcT/CpeT [Usitatibacter sp.]
MPLVPFEAAARRAAVFAVLVLAAACTTAPAPRQAALPIDVDPLVAVRAQRSLELLASFLAGTWNTVAQPVGQGDSTPFRLRIARIWPERAGEYWFYEEYVDPATERPLRQRVFRLVRDDVILHALMYRLPGDPVAFAGEWRKARPMASLDPTALREVQGCRVFWQPQLETYFAGGTEGKACAGDRPGIVNEHSEYYLGSSSMRSWIQGFDAAGNQVEGPTGPSEFRKTSEKLQ